MYHTIDMLSDCSEQVPYKIAGFPAYASRSFLSIYRDMSAASHWHDDLECGVVLSGYMTYAINGTILRVNEGEGVFINTRQLHSNYSTDGSDCEFLCVLIHPSLLCSVPFIRDEYIAPLLANSGFPFTVLRPDTSWQAELMRVVLAIEEVFVAEGKRRPLSFQSYAFQAAEILYQNMPEASPASARIDRRLTVLRNMVGFVQMRYEDKITLADIAAAGSISESSCCAIFQRQLRQTPIGYLARYRLEKGMELLEKPDLSVLDVALAVGFSSASYFTETFRKYLGLTPSEYRKRKKGPL